MRFKISKVCLWAVLIVGSFQQLTAQSVTQYPTFTVKTTGTSNALAAYLEGEYFGRYDKYFSASCGDLFRVVRFRIDSTGRILNASFGDSATAFSRFLADVLYQTSGSWIPARDQGHNITSKWLVLPVYLHVSKKCKDKPAESSDRYPEHPKGKEQPIVKNGYAIQSENENEIVLLPISLAGFLDDEWPRKRILPTTIEKYNN
jgi:hypothetical protein